ncbi:Arm DNA-binding domain-containing protein [Tateyamaria sp.]|uniref:Arm DNA-binding domain-containing protein n=1 Tax=Tateyamaria sp. TaxID=1929288 RepID=UPI003B20EFBF
MPKIEFTAPTVKALRENTDTAPGTYFDTKLPGFGLRVSKRTRKFVVVGYVAGKKVWVTQGPSELTLPKARKWAEGVLGDLARGINPNAAKAEQRASAMRLSEALDTYLSDNDLKESTATENRRLIERDLKDWLNKDVKTISRDMVVKRFDKLTERSPAIANHVFWVLRAILNHTRIVTKNDLGEFTLPPNPCDRLTDLKRWHKPQARKGTVAIDQFPALMDTLAESHDRLDAGTSRKPAKGRSQ